MHYYGAVYRPPSEAYSLIVQCTLGCSHNKCAFCNMYKDKKFSIRPVEEVLRDLAEARSYERRIELCFEGERFFDMRRWASGVDELNRPVSRAVVSESDEGERPVYASEQVENRRFSSLRLPLPSREMRWSPGLVQNEGWDAWN